MASSTPISRELTPAELWWDAAADLQDEAKYLRERADVKDRQARRYVLLAEDWERQHGVSSLDSKRGGSS